MDGKTDAGRCAVFTSGAQPQSIWLPSPANCPAYLRGRMETAPYLFVCKCGIIQMTAFIAWCYLRYVPV